MRDHPAGQPRQAFGDESFREADVGGFYVVAAAVFEPHALAGARHALRALYGPKRGGKLHWSDMDAEQQRGASKRIAELDGFHVVTVGAPVPRRRQERARAMCLTQLVVELHGYGVEILAMEARSARLNARDVSTVAGARYQLDKGAVFRIDHLVGQSEPLLWAADVVAGAVRANKEGQPEFRDLLDDCVYEIDLRTGC